MGQVNFLPVNLLIIVILIRQIDQIKCWDDNGHLLIAQIAKIQLEQTNPKVLNHVEKLVQALGYLSDERSQNFIDSSLWADDLMMDYEGMSFLDTWHIAPILINMNGYNLTRPEFIEKQNGVQCLTEALKVFTQSKNSNKINFNQAFYIRYVLHVVGDLHTPLHCSSLVNATFNTSFGDKVATQIQLLDLENESTTFHRYMDFGGYYLQNSFNKFERPLNSSTQNQLGAWAQELINKYPQKFFGEKINQLDPKVWVQESWEISKNQLYPFAMKTNQITKDFQLQVQEISRQRIVLAGYRLSAFLQHLFEDLAFKNMKKSDL